MQLPNISCPIRILIGELVAQIFYHNDDYFYRKLAELNILLEVEDSDFCIFAAVTDSESCVDLSLRVSLLLIA